MIDQYTNKIHNVDCLEFVNDLPEKSIDLILEDMPYNTTACEWDVKIDLQLYWKTRLRILKPTGAIVLTASQPFTTDLINSNRKMFKYELIWDKALSSGSIMANRRPLKRHENILIFCIGQTIYNPIKRKGRARLKGKVAQTNNYREIPQKNAILRIDNEYYPTSIIEFSNADMTEREHETQKPVGLFEYLIRTDTNEGDLIFDGFAGSGTTAIASIKSKRNFICCEKEKKYFDLAQKRIDDFLAQQDLFREVI